MRKNRIALASSLPWLQQRVLPSISTSHTITEVTSWLMRLEFHKTFFSKCLLSKALSVAVEGGPSKCMLPVDIVGHLQYLPTEGYDIERHFQDLGLG
jgi:hypothetical protein